MPESTALGALSRSSAPTLGAFRGRDAVAEGVSRKRLERMQSTGAIERFLPDTYCLTVVPASNAQRLHAAILWAGPETAVAVRSSGELYRFEGVRATKPEIVVPSRVRAKSRDVIVHHSDDRAAMMIRNVNGLPVTGVEATLLALAHVLDAEALEIACEDARRRQLTSVLALRAYLDSSRPQGAAGRLRWIDCCGRSTLNRRHVRRWR
jgi:hypothetical protein